MTEVRSRKENRQHQPVDVPAPVPPVLPVPDHKDMRRVSQQMYMPSGSGVPISLAQQQTKSPKILGSETNVRTPSGGPFGGDITNMAAQDSSSLDVTVGSAPSSDKGSKRVRHFTPSSVRALEDENDPLRGSPRIRLTPFAEDSPARLET